MNASPSKGSKSAHAPEPLILLKTCCREMRSHDKGEILKFTSSDDHASYAEPSFTQSLSWSLCVCAHVVVLTVLPGAK